ncbi:MAG: ATP-grasp domain-containing protein [Actinomycetota bacterium]|nr:ATP-grasp domain-containing protein [Actinomycetota bacterium]
MKRVVIVAGKASYRTADFLAAASLLRVEAYIVGDGELPAGNPGLVVDLGDVSRSAAAIAARYPNVDAVVAMDDQGVLAAAAAGELLGLRHNSLDAVAATRDKAVLRGRLAGSNVMQPRHRTAPPGMVPRAAAAIGYPVVVKPTGLAASRGVIRVDGPDTAVATEDRVRAILKSAGVPQSQQLLVEEFVPGDEIVIEALLGADGPEVLAIIDKPDAMDGPYFEETLYVTPSRHNPDHLGDAIALVAKAVTALGLETGPIHAEVRISPQGVCYLIEIAARSIGGLCGRSLSFGLLGESLEVMVLRSALGLSTLDASPGRPAAGVLMLPIPATGTLTEIAGIEAARAIDGIDDISITIPIGRRVETLPEGDRYLGFVFAGGSDPESVENALRRAGNELAITIDGEEVRPPTSLT